MPGFELVRQPRHLNGHAHLIMKIRLTCKEAHRMVSEGLDRDLSILERLRIRMHLTACDACTNFNGQMRLLRQAMHQLTVPDDGAGERPEK
jgi:hypothetical protein